MDKMVLLFEEWRERQNLGQIAAAQLIGISQSSYNVFVRQGKAGKIVKRQLLSYLKEHQEEFDGGMENEISKVKCS